MNYFLLLNKKILLTFIVFISLLTVSIIFIKFNDKDKKNMSFNDEFIDLSYDILKPKFTINNEKNKIVVTANKGDFLNDNEILLKNKVLFVSKKFKIYSDKVLFNKNDQTASSENESIFLSEGTKIISKGFDIIEEGNIIQFNGKTSLTLSK